MRSLSLRLRLTVWYSVALVAGIALFAGDVVWSQRRVGTRRVDRELADLTSKVATVVDSTVRSRDDANLVGAIEDTLDAMTLPGNAVAVFDQSGALLASRWPSAAPAAHAPATAAPATVTVNGLSGQWRVHAEPRRLGTTMLSIVAAHSLADVRREQHEVLEAVEVAIPLMLLVAAGGGWWLASIGLRPISEMANRASALPVSGDEDLGHEERSDELGQFARSFNDLMRRLRGAVRTQQQFMADASHELRTPVSVVRAAAEVTLGRETRPEPEYREALTTIRDQSHGLSRLVENMLVLARADAGGYPLRPVSLYLNDLVGDCCRAMQPLSLERQVTVRSAPWPDMPFEGDEDLLRRLVLNVLQNAIQHTPRAGIVGVDVTEVGGRYEIRITDSGRGIAGADRARIFDRFVQLDDARRASGSGLGLPIARWIAEAHSGRVDLESSGPDGSTFLITLPSGRPVSTRS